MSGFVRLFRHKFDTPAPTTDSFAGKTVLVTGTTSGLGLEAVKKLATLNASKIIMTARTIEKGEEAKRQVEKHVQAHVKAANVKSVTHTELVILPLDMSSTTGVQSFSAALHSHIGEGGSLDGVILNAGVSPRVYTKSSDGYEETLQVNLVSTTLLAMLILPILLRTSDSKRTAPHLTFVSSGLAHIVKPQTMTEFSSSASPIRELSKESNFPPGMFGGSTQYARSKLLLEYAVRHIAALPSIYDSSTRAPRVLINSTCPGMCKSDLGRQFTDTLWVRIVLWFIFTLLARTAEQGANSYVSALTRDGELHGETWKNDRKHEPGEMIKSKEGIEFGNRVWTELKDVVVKQAPETKELLL